MISYRKKRKDLPVVRFDPRPPDCRQLTSEAIEKFRCDLLPVNQPSRVPCPFC